MTIYINNKEYTIEDNASISQALKQVEGQHTVVGNCHRLEQRRNSCIAMELQGIIPRRQADDNHSFLWRIK